MLSSLSNHSAIDADFPLSGEEPQPNANLYPLYYRAKKIECNLTSGDMLYIPKGWWHWIFSSEEAISVNFWFNTASKNISHQLELDQVKNSITSDIDQQEYLQQHQPLVIKHGAKSWLSISKWNRDYLSNQNDLVIPQFYSGYGEHSSFAPVQKPNFSAENHNDTMKLFPQQTLKKFYERVNHTLNVNYVAFIPFLERTSIFADIAIPNLLGKQTLDSINLWYSYGRIHTGLHYDDYENILVLVKGNKRVFLYPPNQTKFLYSQTLPMLFNYVKVES